MNLPAVHHSENACVSFPQVLNLAFSEGHNIKIVLPRLIPNAISQPQVRMQWDTLCISLASFFFPLWIYPNAL